MTRWGARLGALAIVSLCVCAAPRTTWAENACAGGGKPRPDEGGIGGTGERPVAPDDDDSGIGGTGISLSGDTGIVGTITGFASICVGGVEIHYDARSAVEIDGETASPAQLAVGQVVEVVARGTGDEVAAQRIAVHHVVAGPVTAVDLTRALVTVMGETVEVPAADDPRYAVGFLVRVNGFRRADGRIAASLITASTDERVQLTGIVSRAAGGQLLVGSTVVVDANATRLDAGDEVYVTGRWSGDQLIASAVRPRPRLPFDGRVSRVEIEGFASMAGTDQIQVGAYVFDVPAARSRSSLPPDARVRVHAVISDQRAVLENIGVVADRPPHQDPIDRGGPRDSNDPNDGPPRWGGDAMDGHHPGAPHERAMPPQPMDAAPRMDAPQGLRPERAERPERPDRPDTMQLPDRPPRIERPPPPQRPEIPDRPPRVDRPVLPGRR